MPRRIHDYPTIFMGWQGMASVGHFITLTSIAFFFFMLLDSHVERRVAIHSTLGIPRWHKRIIYYIFKIRYIQLHQKKNLQIPNKQIRVLLANYNVTNMKFMKIFN